MRTALIAYCLFAFSVLANPCLGQGSVEDYDVVNLSPAGGRWGDQFNTNIVYNPITNRVLTIVVDPGSGRDFKLVRFDASTNAFAGGVPLAGVPEVLQPIILGAEVSSDGKTLLVSWGEAGCGTEEDIPIQLEFFDLSSFVSSSTDIVQNIHLLRFDAIDDTNRFIGIAPPEFPDEPYTIIQVDAETREASAEMEIDTTPDEAFVKDVLFDSGSNRLFVLFVPTGSCGDPVTPTECACFNTLKEGFVKAYNIVNDAVSDPSETIAGEFTRNSLAFSPEAKLVAVAGKDSTRKTFVFQADTLDTVHSVSDSLVFGASQSSLGSTVFGASDQIWLANESATDSASSIAVYDIGDGTVDRYISDADLIIRMISDNETGKIFGASQKYQQIYVLSATADQLTTRIDFTVGPHTNVALDMEVDPINNVFHILSHAGGLHLVSDDGPNYLGRLLDFAPDPTARLETDLSNDRLFVGRRGSEPPIVLETVGYQTTGALSRAADGMALDVGENLLYTTRLSEGTNIFNTTRVIEKFDATTLTFEGKVTELNVPLAISAPADMVVDSERGVLWVLSGRFGTPLLSRIPLNSTTEATTASITGTFERRGKLLIDAERNRVFVLPFSGNPAITSFALDQVDFEGTRTNHTIPLGFIFDARLEPGDDLLYILLRDGASPFYELAALDLNSPTLAMKLVDLDFLIDTEARFARNPITDRFAVLGGQSGRVYLFDNPFSTKRKNKGPRITKNLIPNSGEIRQTAAGIELNWELSTPVGENFRGVVIERRPVGEASWIRLTPLAVPPSLAFWTDTTVEPGQSYDYRITGVGGTEAAPILLQATASQKTRWIPGIPEVVVFLRPGEMKQYLFSVADLTGLSNRVTLNVEGDPALEMSVDPELIPIPGTAQIEIFIPEGTQPDVYTAWVEASDGQTRSRVPLLVRVIPETQSLRTDRILRRTTPITLTSDSELDQKLLSVRGQLGLLRRLANPVPIAVTVDLPDGTTLEATVIASTGEFTADFSVPEDLKDGDWNFQATLPGSFEVVGGRSSEFSIPIFTTGVAEKGLARRFDIGQIVIIAGDPPNGEPPSFIDGATQAFIDVMNTKRFKSNTEIGNSSKADLLVAPKNRDGVIDTIESLDTGRFALLYFMGNTSESDPPRFLFGNGGELSISDFSDMIAAIPHEATPIVIFDCPSAGGFQSELEAVEKTGAHLFSVGNGVRDISFNPETFSFTRFFLEQLKTKRFGKAWSSYTSPLTRLTIGLTNLRPAATWNGKEDRFRDLPIGSHFTESGDLVPDLIGSDIIRTSTSGIFHLNEEIPLRVETVDTPFEKAVGVRAVVLHPVSDSEAIVLENPGEINVHSGSLTLKDLGETHIVFQAVDSNGAISEVATTVTVCDSQFDVHRLLSILNELKQDSPVEGAEGSALEMLFAFTKSWCP